MLASKLEAVLSRHIMCHTLKYGTFCRQNVLSAMRAKKLRSEQTPQFINPWYKYKSFIAFSLYCPWRGWHMRWKRKQMISPTPPTTAENKRHPQQTNKQDCIASDIDIDIKYVNASFQMNIMKTSELCLRGKSNLMHACMQYAKVLSKIEKLK